MIKATGFEYEKFNFPVGELHIKIKHTWGKSSTIEWDYENDSEILEVITLSHYLRAHGVEKLFLELPYVPFSREDRAEIGHGLLVFCQLINFCNFDLVVIKDPHSDVTPALLNKCVTIQQHNIFSKYFHKDQRLTLVSPDAGSLKKIYKLATEIKPLQIIECSKVRNYHTGVITGTYVKEPVFLENNHYIVDDICDGGKTFIEIAHQLKGQHVTGKIILMVTHGFFTKGLEVFDGLIDEIYTRKGKIK